MLDVLIAGGGPAGSIAALQLARAGARVLIVDRESPRVTACAGLLDRTAISGLEALGLSEVISGAPAVTRALVTGPHAQWMAESSGDPAVVIDRPRFDRRLLEAAIKAGAKFEDRVVVRRPLIDEPTNLVRGAVLCRRKAKVEVRMPAAITIGADGRHSRLASHMGLLVSGPMRRWAFGLSIETRGTGVDAGQAELHVRNGWYAGVVPAGPDVARLVVVLPAHAAGRTPAEVVRLAVSRDPLLADRFGRAVVQGEMPVAGPLASSVAVPGAGGLLLAGDAAGAVDPLTGDGLAFAIVGGDLAATAAAQVILDGSFAAAPWRLAAMRRDALGAKLRANRWATRLVDSPLMFDVASRWATRFPMFARRVVNYARHRTT
jgi:flavin-dependent dehydrogenase